MDSLRASGIDIIGNVSWGTHISYLYSSKQDFINVLVPYINSGLKNNELCIWVYSQSINYEEAITILQTSIGNIDAYIERNQLKLLPFTQWYCLDNSFNEIRLNQQWQELIKHAKDNGFDGLRAVVDTAWLTECYTRDFEQYEQKLNEIITEHCFIALCLYDINKISIAQVAEIISNHNYTLITDDSKLKMIKNVELLIKEKQLAESKRLLDEALELNKLKDEFLSNISHELRTPLNVILSAVQLLRQYNEKPTQSFSYNIRNNRENKYLKIIQQNCYRQLRLINNLIDITKCESNYYELHLQNCNIVEIVENITLSVAEYIENKGITLVFDTNLEELIIACDPDQIERIILNLLSNATKFTNAGGSISVNINGGSDKVVITIKDTGIGIPQDKLDCIFNRFQRVDMSFSSMHEGSGIGLSLVKSLVEKHNGKIKVKSEMGKGTEFIIELPCMTISETSPSSLARKTINMKNLIEKINIEFSDIYL